MDTVFITGANRGLGKCLIEEFLERGWRVFAGTRTFQTGSSGAPSAGAVARDESPRLSWVLLDVTDADSVARASSAVSSRSPSLDVLINNAAVNPRPEYDAPLGELDFSAIHQAYDVNALGPLRVIQGFMPLLDRGSRKVIINVSSEAGSLRHSWRDRSYGYCMSKAALNMQTTILDRALRPRGYQVLALHPGWMRTDMGGAQAELDPRESAAGMYQVISRANADTPRFLQHDGREFPW